jgi:hypothetical protein
MAIHMGGAPPTPTPPPRPPRGGGGGGGGGGAGGGGGGGGRKFVMEIHMEGAPPMMQCHGAHGEGYRRWQEESGGGGRVVGVEVKGRAETA